MYSSNLLYVEDTENHSLSAPGWRGIHDRVDYRPVDGGYTPQPRRADILSCWQVNQILKAHVLHNKPFSEDLAVLRYTFSTQFKRTISPSPEGGGPMDFAADLLAAGS